MSVLSYKPIGFFSCPQNSPVESPRQGVLAKESRGFVHLNSDIDRQALQDLKGFERVWLIYDFHKNKKWSPMVRPPRGSEQKRGVFATRSPYRPNSIGMSCVLLGEIKNHVIEVLGHDLLDETPILDIKPYLPYADSFNDSKIGWLEDIKKYEVHFLEQASLQMTWLESYLKINLKEIIENQLAYEPLNKKIKRVRAIENFFVYSYKTWRVHFTISENSVAVMKVESGYSLEDLENIEDPYGDKAIHKLFRADKICSGSDIKN